MTPYLLAEAARLLIERERRTANQCVAAMQTELDLLNRWAADPGGLRSHNLNGLMQLVINAQRALHRLEALEEITS